MVRRSFRLGLWAGLLLGVAAALVKTVQGWRDGKELTSPPPDRWAPAPPAATVTAPAAAPFAPTPAPPVPAAAPPTPTAEIETDRWDSEPWPSDITDAPAAEDTDSGDASSGGTQPARDERLREEPSTEPSTERPPRSVKSVPAGEAPATKPAATPRKTVAAAKRVADTAKRTPIAKAVTWVRPVAGVCPPTHPVKGKLASRLFHLPGMFAYDRTRADRCYISEAAAVADGLTRAKR